VLGCLPVVAVIVVIVVVIVVIEVMVVILVVVVVASSKLSPFLPLSWKRMISNSQASQDGCT
jgi:hypothetical protein